MKNNKKGFTLVELIVVIAIIGILAAVLFPTITGYITNARVSQHEQEAGSINTVLASESIFSDVDYYQPEELETLLVGMDYQLKSSVKGYAFFYHVEANRVEFLKISDAQSHESELVYQGIESLFDNGLAYIDQSNNDIRQTIDGIRNLVADVRIEALKVDVAATIVEDDYYKVSRAIEARFQKVKANLKSISSKRLDLFDPKNGVLYFDHSGTYGNTDKVIQVVVFTPSISTLKTAYANLKLSEDLVIEIPSTVTFVESSLFSNAKVYDLNGVISTQKATIIAPRNVKFTGFISDAINIVLKGSTIDYQELLLGTDYFLQDSIQKTTTTMVDNKPVNKVEQKFINDQGVVPKLDLNPKINTIQTIIPTIKLVNGQSINFKNIISIDVRSKIESGLTIFTGVVVDNELNGYKVNYGSILDVKSTVGDLRNTIILAEGEVIGKRVTISDPLQGYNFDNLEDLKIVVTLVDSADILLSNVELLKVDENSTLSKEVKVAYMGDYYFEGKGIVKNDEEVDFNFNKTVKIIEIKIYNGDKLIFIKK